MDEPLVLRDLPAHERPRERMLAVGAEQLSVAELLAILLRTGHRDESVLALAQRLLKQFGSLRELAGARVEELTAVKGVGIAKAVQVKAGLELGRRLARLAAEERLAVRGPGDVARLLMDELRFLPNEHFVCLFLNTKNHIIGKQTVFVGTLNATVVHPREIFREAIRRASAAVILAHNHPSGPGAEPRGHRADAAAGRGRGAPRHSGFGPHRHRRQPVREFKGKRLPVKEL